MNDQEYSAGCSSILTMSDDFTVHLASVDGKVKKTFSYDGIFGPEASQEQVFEDSKRLVQSAVDGFNVCIFAYGQTGSGKTHTVIGQAGNEGIAPRAILELFSLVRALPSHFRVQVSCYMVELYVKHLIDLFQPNRQSPPPLTIRKDAREMTMVQGAIVRHARNAEELMQFFTEGNSRRHTDAHKMNSASSRSHLIFSVLVEVLNTETEQATVGKLSLVDLAGSERMNRTEATHKMLTEAMAINKSLTALHDVINALSVNDSHIPYRNDKLTHLMSDSLGGKSKTLMIVNVSPASVNIEETGISLFYASHVKMIKNEPAKNIENKELARIRQELTRVNDLNDRLVGVLETKASPEEIRQVLALSE